MSMQSVVPSASQSPADYLSAPENSSHDADRFITLNPSMRKLITRAELVAPHLRVAAVQGEGGAGKQTLAGFLYDRAAAATPGLARSGFRRCDAREWLLDATDPHTVAGFIYLDRVDLLAAPGQALLLRTLKGLQTRAAGVAIVVASTESCLRELAAKGQFISDLAFRLTAIQFMVPPLRERREDIVPLATLFLDRLRQRYRLPGFALAHDAVSRLLQHDWPGNVRELSAVLESAVLECSEGIIREADLCLTSASPRMHNPIKPPQILNLDAVIRNHVNYVLELNRGNKLRAAQQLGISRSTLYRMLEAAALPLAQ